MTPHHLQILGGSDFFRLFFWLLDQLGIEPTESQIRKTFLGVVVLVVLTVLIWLALNWLQRGKAPQDEKAEAPTEEKK